MSSCLSGSGRAYGFELNIVKPSSPSSGRSSSPSSTLSDSSNSPRRISIKKARAPRKRPNQTYNEAAALLSTIYPNVFSTKSLKRLSNNTTVASFPESSDLLPPLPVLSDAAFLIHQAPQQEKPAADVGRELKHKILVDWECASPVSNASWDPNSPDPFDDDFDAESILDEEVEEGIDSIMGDLAARTSSKDNNDGLNHSNPPINPLLRSLIGHKMGAKFELGLGFRTNLQRALKNRDDTEWWRSPTTVPVRDINPHLEPFPTPASEKKKKKKVDKEVLDNTTITENSTPTPSVEKLKVGLGLKLRPEEVLKAWSGRGSMFSDGPDSSNSSADALARLADIDLFLDAGGVAGGVREASVLRYKEKRRTRLFSKKIRYQVRKTNADQRPRMKGRFVRKPSLLQEAMEEESQ
ncbi:protein CHLOROPLAST IMPORT APPARATUS 2-like isoform X2 [Canna indica]|uniref:Protein CHLOROPLAST IMPORT APPARATUS 2-like isoform X2 n=1 Tax=Canna indica TaxID=4628 RepID=A0AAQ3JSK4_9LILI|nr:protein CHLOROPLAST IMPORT APPARATUS 2-like isoform X2 [Canna indica]